MTTPALADARQASLTTSLPSGEAVVAPVWVVALDDGRLGCWPITATDPDLAARLARDPRVRLAPGGGRGRAPAGTPSYDGEAVVVRSGAAYLEVRGRVRAKYGVRVVLARLLVGVVHPGHGRDVGSEVVVVTLT